MLSLGTGELVRSIPYEQAKDWGQVAGNAAARLHVRWRYKSRQPSDEYIPGDNYLRYR